MSKKEHSAVWARRHASEWLLAYSEESRIARQLLDDYSTSPSKRANFSTRLDDDWASPEAGSAGLIGAFSGPGRALAWSDGVISTSGPVRHPPFECLPALRCRGWIRVDGGVHEA